MNQGSLYSVIMLRKPKPVRLTQEVKAAG